MSRALGNLYEDKAHQLIMQSNYKTVARNFQVSQGEIDLIALSPDQCLCFIEVKYRHSQTYGGAIAAVSLSKQAKIIKTAQAFLHQNAQWRQHAMRFDVIAYDLDAVEWIKHAFLGK